MTPWTPFQDALFYPGLRHPDKRVMLSDKEIYVRSQNKWTFHVSITTESGKKLAGYILKQMESVLRKAVNYKYRLSAGADILSPITAEMLSQAGIHLERLVTEAAMEFYRETTRTVVKVNPETLARIRREALITQEKLIVPEQLPESAITETADLSLTAPTRSYADAADIQKDSTQASSAMKQPLPIMTAQDGQLVLNSEMLSTVPDSAPVNIAVTAAMSDITGISQPDSSEAPSDPWECLENALTDVEQEALLLLWREQTGYPIPADAPILQWNSIEQYAREQDIMPEVLIDGINEKAMDHVGDNILDGEFAFYEDYTEQMKGMMKRIWQQKYPQESPIH